MSERESVPPPGLAPAQAVAPAAPQPAREHSLGQLVADAGALTTGYYLALVVVLIGSIGPWVTSPLASVAGIDGDGKLTVLFAVLAGLTVAPRRGLRALVGAACCLVILAIGIFDAIHIHVRSSSATFDGTQLVHVGWGVYAVIAGAVAALAVVYRARKQA